MQHKDTHTQHNHSERMLALVRWTAGLGAVTAEGLAWRSEISLQSARGRLRAAGRAGLLRTCKPLEDQPRLYTATASGIKAACAGRLDPCRVSNTGALHLIACCAVAVGLERCYPEHAVLGERELRREEHEHGLSLASATLGHGRDGEPLLHRPDLVLWAQRVEDGARPVAVEVELTVKAPRRLQAICRAWARCSLVGGVIYIAAPEVLRPLLRARAHVRAEDQIVVLPLEALPGPITQAVPSRA